MAVIALSRGKVAIVDDIDYDWLMAGPKWTCDSKNYAVRHVYENGRRVMEKMHRVILRAPPEQDVDHRDTDTLNNHRSNLRLATMELNGANRNKQRLHAGKPTKSVFKGVWFDAKRSKWRATIRVKGHLRQIGRFLSEIEAAKAYDQAAIAAWGKYARPNFTGATRACLAAQSWPEAASTAACHPKSRL